MTQDSIVKRWRQYAVDADAREAVRDINGYLFVCPEYFKPDDSGYEPTEEKLPKLPTSLHAEEQHRVLSQVNDRLSRCASDLVAKYQFPLPVESDKLPVCIPDDHEWWKSEYFLKTLAEIRRRIDRVLLNRTLSREQPAQMIIQVDNRHAAEHQSRPLQDHDLGILENPTKQYIQRRSRRGRGQRKNDAYWSDYNQSDADDPFDARDCLFSDASGRVKTPALANLDTGLKVPGGLIMSSNYAKELGRQQDISRDFEDPCLRSICGHLTPVTGILRDVVFRMKGTSVTFKRDFFICDAIDDMVDIMFGASFIKDQFKLLFEQVKGLCSNFATWFSTKKETAEEKLERQQRELDQKRKAHELEQARLNKEAARIAALQKQFHSQHAASGRQ